MKIISNSVYDSQIKQMNRALFTDDEKKVHREKALEDIFFQLGDKVNRYIFYCPDISLVNNLVKLIYETAWEAKKLGYNVLILHEIDGFKCKWLFENPNYKHLKDIDVDYVIKKKSAKSKKTKSNYSFKPSDTLIVPDQFQEMLDNLLTVKLVQKVVLVSSYVGMSAIQPGVDYSVLGVSRLLFIEKQLEDDYLSLFQNVQNHLIDNYPVNDLFKIERKVKEVYPVIIVSGIGNTDFVQQLINIFFSKYPNLRTFSFKVLERSGYEAYIDAFSHAALFLVLDKNMGNRQMMLEAIAAGLPVGTNNRRECDKELAQYTFLGEDAFEIAENLAMWAQEWLNNSTTQYNKIYSGLAINLNGDKTYENFSKQLAIAFKDLQEEKIKYFASIKQAMDKEEEKALKVV